jgi:hypothetical protein
MANVPMSNFVQKLSFILISLGISFHAPPTRLPVTELTYTSVLSVFLTSHVHTRPHVYTLGDTNMRVKAAEAVH